MATDALRSEERVGLAIALAAHVALLLVLVVRPPSGPAVKPPDRIEVMISDEVALKSTSPEPNADAAPDVAPELGEPAPAEAVPLPRPEEPPRPRAEPVARPSPRPAPSPRAAPRPSPRPSPRAAPPKPTSRATSSRKSGESSSPKPKPSAKPGGSRVGSDFLEGVQGAKSSGTSKNPPAQVAGPAVKSSLLGSISRQLKPYWQGKVPEGADSEKLVTTVTFNLNRDGTLAGAPRVVRQSGETPANAPQAPRHAEQAIRAVELAAPFDLPPEYYDVWKRVTINFDKRLSQ